ncbi:ubiquinone biosynthesis hydroxylase UbiH [Betaproteobacteria bacterium]|nr:ubiquinone biosynthesis hydroxylase UbiH [Betaproteobacteria bacterium]GHU22269.1 ubiquinone biosynthesis hydroxylase UbiH [Betaproteobacteria bacterium]GHU31300.1 ubiquinone biosynthesis hydroxylase UbiH [Betaproteobacteria bacterium]
MRFDLIIVGGGLAGTALAVALRRSRLNIALIQRAVPTKAPGWDARIYAYNPASVAFLQELGVWERLDPGRLAPVERMEVHGDGGGRIDFSAAEAGLEALAWIGESDHLLLELWQSLTRQHNVTVFAPAAPAACTHHDDGVEILLEDGRKLAATLVVGADGRDSWVRHAFGIEAKSRDYGQQAIVANFRVERPHQQCAWQWFRNDGIVAWLPLPGERISLVWSTREDTAARLMALPDAAFCHEVAAAGGELLGRLALETPRADFSLRFMRVASVLAGRGVLVGDAAHAIHPLTGHGINLGFQDVRTLAALLAEAPAWQDIGERMFLRRYERARAEEPFMLQYATDGLARLFACRNPLAGVLRNAGMALAAQTPGLTRCLTRYAASGPF